MIYILKKSTYNFIILSTNLIARKSILITLKINLITLHFYKIQYVNNYQTSKISVIFYKKRDEKSLSHLKLTIYCKL
jgi:hypothetical protein